MYTQTGISGFKCEYCHRLFSVSDYKGDVQETKTVCCEHQKQCHNKIKICLGDVFIFNTEQRNECGYPSVKTSPPMKVIWVDIKNPDNKQLHVVLTKYNPILKVWQIDQKAMQPYKKKYNIQYFTMYESQINRQISLSDFKESFKIVEVLSNWIDQTSLHGKKQCKTNIGYDWQNNNILLTIKIPYKTKGRT